MTRAEFDSIMGSTVDTIHMQTRLTPDERRAAEEAVPAIQEQIEELALIEQSGEAGDEERAALDFYINILKDIEHFLENDGREVRPSEDIVEKIWLEWKDRTPAEFEQRCLAMVDQYNEIEAYAKRVEGMAKNAGLN